MAAVTTVSSNVEDEKKRDSISGSNGTNGLGGSVSKNYEIDVCNALKRDGNGMKLVREFSYFSGISLKEAISKVVRLINEIDNHTSSPFYIESLNALKNDPYSSDNNVVLMDSKVLSNLDRCMTFSVGPAEIYMRVSFDKSGLFARSVRIKMTIADTLIMEKNLDNVQIAKTKILNFTNCIADIMFEMKLDYDFGVKTYFMIVKLTGSVGVSLFRQNVFWPQSRVDIGSIVLDKELNKANSLASMRVSSVGVTSTSSTSSYGDIITNKNELYPAGKGGHSFFFYDSYQGSVVTKFEAWSQKRAIRGIRVTYSNHKSDFEGTKKGTYDSITFDYNGGEYISNVKIFANKNKDRVGSIRIGTKNVNSNKTREFWANKSNRNTNKTIEYECGSGVMVGVTGYAGEDIDGLGIGMLRSYTGVSLEDVVYQSKFPTPNPVSALEVQYENPNDQIKVNAVEQEVSKNREESASGTWKVETSSSATNSIAVKASVNAKVPVINVGGSAGTDVTNSVTVSENEMFSETTSWKDSTNYKTTIRWDCPPLSAWTVHIDYYETPLSNIAFTGSQVYTLDNGKKFVTPVTGRYDGYTSSMFEQYATKFATYDPQTDTWTPFPEMLIVKL